MPLIRMNKKGTPDHGDDYSKSYWVDENSYLRIGLSVLCVCLVNI